MPTASQARCSLLSEGSVIAYYRSEFSIPTHLVEEAERAMAQERTVTLPPRARAMQSFVLTSVVAFRECRGARVGHLLGQPSVEQGWAVDHCMGDQQSQSQCTEERSACWSGPSLSENKEAGIRK